MTPTNEIGLTHNRYWELSDAELEDFFKEMGSERASMSLTLDQLRSARVIVVERDRGQVIAVAGVRRARRLNVAFYVVLAPFQGHGLGKALVRRLHSALNKIGYRLVCLSVQCGNVPAVRLYRSKGYRTFFFRGDNLYMFRLLSRKDTQE